MQLGTIFTIGFIAVGIIMLSVASLTIFPAMNNNKDCPTGSAICSTAAMLPGAVTIFSALIIVVIIASLAFVVLYIRSHS